MNDTSETLNTALDKLSEAVKIAVNRPSFKAKLTLKKQIHAFSALLCGKSTKEETNHFMVKASCTGDYKASRGYTQDAPHPYGAEGALYGESPTNSMLFAENPYTIKFDPANLNY
jgi:hypothetical protein